MSELNNPNLWESIRVNTVYYPNSLEYFVDNEAFRIVISPVPHGTSTLTDENGIDHLHQQFKYELKDKFIFAATFDYYTETFNYLNGGLRIGQATILMGERWCLNNDFVESNLTLLGDTSIDDVYHHLTIIALTLSP